MKHLFKSVLVAAGLFLTVGAVSAQQKIGHVNSQEILLLMPEYKTANQTLETFVGTKRTEIQQMDAERQKKITAFMDKQKTRSEANKETVDKELQTLSTEIQQMEGRMGEVQQKAEQEVGAKREEVFQPVFEKAEKAIQAVAKEKGYAYILDIAQQSVLYFEGGDDISAAVKTKLGIDPNAKPVAPAATTPTTTTPATK
ncbi:MULTISPECIES: OmpH family outer membrane protein [Olivibacter]|jgi:outer membrane protein|uniref:Outer membrane chaperone Skp (OmpH) n=3 Tax=Sphingobacteriaceae TaxID=84566 RepID=F4C4V7_SPHS2|nr:MULTISPECIES: OmpH family outer membrane protein [Olivibacter]MCL4637649.1 OmpH family outer membrane protein [Olivibacter sp. UJ_SKK_5.1]MDM8173897.1 OmpH family outer membrane protein [Olivibacter sp. 47]MDX3915081.1 OmpH family outer membrane protein [Pseudosphingobacterium sp.]QEL03684.1 OmpH family outer membrane protein [Olivibacter sp. LS-1]